MFDLSYHLEVKIPPAPLLLKLVHLLRRDVVRIKILAHVLTFLDLFARHGYTCKLEERRELSCLTERATKKQ